MLKGRSFLKLLDFTTEELQYLLDLAKKLKEDKKNKTEKKKLVGKNIALIFEKTSTRTRCAFEVAAYDQGANVTYIGPSTSQRIIRNLLKTLQRFWEDFMTGLNIGDTGRIWLKHWQSILVCLFGTGLRLSFILHRF